MYIEDHYWELMGKQVSNDISLQEEKELMHWIEQDASRATMLKNLQQIWWDKTLTYGENIQVDQDLAWERVKQRLQVNKPNEQPVKVKPLFRFWQIAATIALVCVLGISIYRISTPKMIAIATLAGEHKKVVLPDGSQVWLNENSEISYQANFANHSERNLELHGEAFFEVTKNKTKPFIVDAGKSKIEVLGTSFDVRVNKNGSAKVSLFTGKISFKNKQNVGEGLTLIPGDVGNCQQDGALSKSTYSDANFMFWKTQKLEFTNVSVAHVLKDVEKYYKVQFLIKDTALSTRKMTSSFQGDSVEQVISILELLLDVRITKTTTSSYTIQAIN